MLKDVGIRCKRPKVEPEHAHKYDDGKKQVKDYRQVESIQKKVMMVFEMKP
jgi:hypothetical protein